MGGAAMSAKRILVALTLALLVSGVCTWLVSKRLSMPRAAKREPDAQYVAPSRALQSGEMLRADNTELVAWPGSNPIDGAFSRAADVLGREAMFPLSKGQPVLERDLSTVGSGTGLAAKIPDGMRAVALRSDEVVGVAGFLVPGSHLDVLVTYSSPEPVTATVLQNAVVIAAGHQTEPDPDGKTDTATVVTLLLTPDGAERAVLASTQGAIHFVLRNGSDGGRTEAPPLLLSQLSGQAPATVRVSLTPHIAKGTAAQKRFEIETILGGGDGGGGAGTAAAAATDGGTKP
jgi:pilus assembly protein CpaB